MTLKCLAAKITPKNAHLITLSDEKRGTMQFKALKMGFLESKGQLGPLSVVKHKANVSCQLNFRLFVSCRLKFWPFISCQLTSQASAFRKLKNE